MEGTKWVEKRVREGKAGGTITAKGYIRSSMKPNRVLASKMCVCV